LYFCPLKSSKRNSVEEKLIFVVSKHHRFGWKFYIFWAKTLKNGGVEILGVPEAKKEEQRGMPEIDVKLIKLIDEVTDTALMKAYSKTKSLADFIKEVSQETIDKYIRPRIEINIRRVINSMKERTLPIYLRTDISHKTLSESDRITILPALSQCLFNFVKDENGLRYFISLTNEEQEMSLQQKPAFVLSQEPCIILLGNKIHRVENIESKKLMPFFDKSHIAVPAASETAYIQTYVLKTIPRFEVKIEGLDMTQLFPSRKAMLTLDEDFYQQLTLFLHFHYDNLKINPALRKTKFVELKEIDGNETICWFTRDLEWEQRLVNRLFELGLRLEGDNGFQAPSNSPERGEQPTPFGGVGGGLIRWLNTNIHNLSDFTIEQKINKIYYTGSITLQSKIDIKIDWFDIEIEVVLDNFRIPFSRFGKHILNGNIEYVLPDKSVLVLPEEWFQRYSTLFLHVEETEKGIRLHKMHAGLLNESVSELFSEKVKHELQKFNQLPEERPVLSTHLNAILRPYQKQGFYWLAHLYEKGLGGCLADDMGLGKTLQTIALLDYVYSKIGKNETLPDSTNQLPLFALQESTLPASLIVVPKSLLHNWHYELKKFDADLNVYVYTGNQRIQTKDIGRIFNQYQIIITSYSLLRVDIEYLKAYHYHYIILDESHYIKNSDSLLYQSIQKLHSSHKLVLTGTPIENSLHDLWAQFNFINPGLLGTSVFFKNNYIQPIKENNKNTELALQQLIQPLFLRRTKDEVAPELPPLSEEIILCDMTESQQEIYDMEKYRIRNILLENRENPSGNNFIALQGLMRLRLLANHPSLVYADYREDSGKFDQIMLYFEILRESGHKVLIFSSFVKHLKLLSARFEQEGWDYAMLTGQTADREAEINKFNPKSDVNCFLISLKAGGTGLNLTAADYVFIIDPWWNPAAEAQAFSRAHRIGQAKNVMVYRFISSETIEEKIMLLQQSKRQLFDTFIASNNPLDLLDWQEIEALL